MSAFPNKAAIDTRFRFVSSNGGPPKRQQSQKACERCRKRKKRCIHTGADPQPSELSQDVSNDNHTIYQDPSSSSPSNASHSTLVLQRPSTGRQQPEHGDGSQSQDPHAAATTAAAVPFSEFNSSQAIERARNVELDVRNQTEPSRTPLTQGGHNSRFIGDLNPEGIFLAATSPDATRGVPNDSVGVWLTNTLGGRASQSPASTPQSPSNLFYGSGSLVQKVLVPMLEQECLSAIPPLEHFEALSRIYFDKVHSIFPVINVDAYHDLGIGDAARILLQQGICLAASKNFSARPHLILPNSSVPLGCREFGEKISGAMRMSLEMGIVKNKLVLIQALALMSQFTDNPVGEDISSQLCTRAVHHVQSLGIHHIQALELHPTSELEKDRNQYSTTLLCCVWAVDRMNAAFHGRPVLMHERDLRKDFENCFNQQGPCFRVFLQIVVLLDRVIDLYRPSGNSINNTGLTWDLPAFEDIVMKCDASQIGSSALATIEALYHAVAILSCRSKTWEDLRRSSTSYLRQSLSISIVSSTVCYELQDQLTLFPFVPYAISLSLSIAYREMRHSKLPLHRARSRTQFQILCNALSELQDTFWSASTTSEMGKKLLKEMDRVFSAVSTSEHRRPTQDLDASNIVGAGNSNDTPQEQSNHTSFERRAMMDNVEQVPQQSMQDFDLSTFDSIADIDLFGMFDPEFDLDGFDACLEGSLHPGFPTGF